ncbi:3'-5' exonuclease [Lacticaseibacillus sp. N501-2]|uniref:3'-5' exonuclease n=1 Tax=Lacticaseibacillus salsurae TaxID=3367729 RepID=UPI0038B267DC
MDELKQTLQAPFSEAWADQLLKALQELARIGGGRPQQLALVDLTLDLRGLWPVHLTLDGQALATGDLWPAITATATLEALPVTGKAVDWVVRKLFRTYVAALRDPANLPQSVQPQWALVHAMANHFQALGAVVHQLHLADDQEPVKVRLFGPLAEETVALMAQYGVTYTHGKMLTPWAQAFSSLRHMEDLSIAKAKPRRGVAEAGLQRDVLGRAKALKTRHFPKTPAPAFTPQRPILQPFGGRPDAYTVFDLEFSSGNKQEGQFATEIGAIKVRNARIVDTFDCFVQIPHGMRLNSRSQSLTGIHTGLLMRYGRPAGTALTEFQNFIGKDPLLGFAVKGGDLLVMQRQFGLYATPGRLLDVAEIAKAGGPMPGGPDVGLAKYRNYLGLDILAHGAVYDAVTTYALYAYLQGSPLLPEVVMAQFNQVFEQTSFKSPKKNFHY